VVSTAIDAALSAEKMFPEYARKRARRPADLETFKAIVEPVVCHAVKEALRGAGPFRTPFSKKLLGKGDRYAPKLNGISLYSQQLPHIVRLLADDRVGFLQLVEGREESQFGPGFQARVAAGPKLIELLDGVTLEDIGRHPGGEVILLRDTHENTPEGARPELVNYKDCAVADSFRDDVRAINASLAAADIQYTGNDPVIDDRKRHLHRAFTKGRLEFNHGGRLYGAFWIPMHKEERLRDVLIDGEPVVSIDLSATYVQIAYGYGARCAPPEGDLYAITFKDTSGSTVVIPRDVVKSAVSARFNGAEGWPEKLKEYSKVLPWRQFVACLHAAHPALTPWLDSDCGQHLTFIESAIMVDVLKDLQSQDITALPVHDCVVVAESNEGAAVQAMRDAFKTYTNNDARLKVERHTLPANAPARHLTPAQEAAQTARLYFDATQF
jgi:hypothetical protein